MDLLSKNKLDTARALAHLEYTEDLNELLRELVLLTPVILETKKLL